MTTSMLEQLSAHDLLTAADEVRLAQRIEAGEEARSRIEAGRTRSGDRELMESAISARQQFLTANVRLVRSVAARMRIPPYADRADVVQDGILGLDTAISKFDWRRGYKFSTYATWWIRRAIQQGLETAAVIRIPSHRASELRTARAVADSDDLPDRLHVVARFDHVESLERRIGSETTVGDLLASTELGPDHEAERRFDQRATTELLDQLEPAVAEAVIARFGLDGDAPRTFVAIARDQGVTPETARRRVQRALERLRPSAEDLAGVAA